MKNASFITKIFILVVIGLTFVQCHTTTWVSVQKEGELQPAPKEIISIFDRYNNQRMVLDAKTPGFDYDYDIGEKDFSYGKKDSVFRFHKVYLKLKDRMPKGKVIVDFTFVDPTNNKIAVNNVDLLRLTPKFDATSDMIYPEIIGEEFNRFGYVFRKEHEEFSISLSNNPSDELLKIEERAYRCTIVNNCLAATKWEFELTSTDYWDYKARLKDSINLNQNKVLSHSWFYIDKALYAALIHLKNPGKDIPYNLEYHKLSDLAEQVTIKFSSLRNLIKRRLNTETIEIGYKSGRKIEPLDNELFYKKYYKLLLEGNANTYTTILDSPVETTQFKDEGFYTATTSKKFDLNWMKHLDSVHLDVIDIKGTDAYIEITLTGQWSPYKINIGNVDLALLSEQKMYGMLFGINTYPKSRRYNPEQNTLVYDPELIPDEIKPFVFLTNKNDDTWVNNQYKGVEKIYLTHESIEKDVLQIYVLSYERITPVWMARIKLPKEIIEKIRIRKSLYSY